MFYLNSPTGVSGAYSISIVDNPSDNRPVVEIHSKKNYCFLLPGIEQFKKL